MSTELRGAPASTDVRCIRVPRRGRLSDCRQRRLSHRSAFLFCNPDVTFTINLRCRGLLSTTRDIQHRRAPARTRPRRTTSARARAHAKGRIAGSPFTKKRARSDTLSEFHNLRPSISSPIHLCLHLSDKIIRNREDDAFVRRFESMQRRNAALNGLSLNLDETRLHEHPNVSHVYV